MRPRIIVSGVVFALLLMGVGCTARITTPPIATLLIVTAPRVTLPPAWTPVPTETALPTRTPLPTETALPTLTTNEICGSFGLTTRPATGAEYDYDATLTFAWTNVPTGVRLTLAINLHDAKQGLRLDVDAPGDNIVPIPLLRLPEDTGRYDWKLGLQHPLYGEICKVEGYFTRRPLKIL